MLLLLLSILYLAFFIASLFYTGIHSRLLCALLTFLYVAISIGHWYFTLTPIFIVSSLYYRTWVLRSGLEYHHNPKKITTPAVVVPGIQRIRCTLRCTESLVSIRATTLWWFSHAPSVQINLIAPGFFFIPQKQVIRLVFK